MSEQEISKWGPEAIADSVELMLKSLESYDEDIMQTDEVLVTNRAIELLREYAKKKDKKADTYAVVDKYMEMLPELMERIFPKPIEGAGNIPSVPLAFAVPKMPPEEWIITENDCINFTNLKY